VSDPRVPGGPGDAAAEDAPGGLTCEAVREMAGAFVLGALDAADDAAVRRHLASCSELHPEIAELGGVLPALALGVPVVEPPDGLKARLMAAAAADLAARTSAGGPVPAQGGVTSSVGVAAASAGAPAASAGVPAGPAGAAPPPPTPFPSATGRPTRRTGPLVASWVLRIAAIVAIVALGAWNVLLRVQLDSAEAYEQAVAAVLEVAAQPGSLTAILAADGGTGSGLAAVSTAGDVTLAMQDLAPTSGTAVYETWVIASDGVPVPLGSFTVDRSGTASFEAGHLPTEPGIVLALTLEPGPGATTPTLPIISKGVADPSG
jgi:anti-sigma-K factor RskA